MYNDIKILNYVMSEFVINSFIKVRLEFGKTNIYINNELFKQCKYVLTKKKIYELEELRELDSIDDLAEDLDHSLEGIEPELIDIPVETRFWVHCSNLQVWNEQKYDSRLLHSNLAFPLLKRLVEVGDPLAKQVFKEEIAERLEKGSFSTVIYLFDEGYYHFLEKEEYNMVIYNKTSRVFENLIKYLGLEKRDEEFVDVILDLIYDLEIDGTLKEKIINLLKEEGVNVLIELIKWELIENLNSSDLEDLFNSKYANFKENLIQLFNPEGLEKTFKRKKFLDYYFNKLLALFKKIDDVVDLVQFIDNMPDDFKKILFNYLTHNLQGCSFYGLDFISYICELYKRLKLNNVREIKIKKIEGNWKPEKFTIYYLSGE